MPRSHLASFDGDTVTDHAVIVDVEATRPKRQAEVGSVRLMLDRVKDTFNLNPEQIIADTAYGSGTMLGWLVAHSGD